MALKICTNIARSRLVSFEKFITALGILGVGKSTAKSLSNEFKSLADLSRASIERLLSISDVGPITATSIFNYFSDTRNAANIRSMIESGVVIARPITMSDKFLNKVFCITGKFNNITRGGIESIIANHSGHVSDSVSKKTHYLVVGSDAGSKLDKAKELGIRCLTEEDFMELCK